MAAFPYKPRVFMPSDALVFGLLLSSVTGLAIAATVTHQDPPVPVAAWVILWAAVAGVWGVSVAILVYRWRWNKMIRFTLAPPGLVVGWNDERFAVSADAVEAEVRSCVLKLTPTFPNAADALRGCVVWMREPAWLFAHGQAGVGTRLVAGLQDGELIIVGWRQDLSTSALQHELAHRVLQMQGGDPPEAQAHELFVKLGL